MSLTNNQDPSPQTVTFPDHLIFEEILPKLPVKSLIRFKSVSKSWLSTISSPEFVKTHLKFSSFHPQFLIYTAIVDEKDFKIEILSLHYDEPSCKIQRTCRVEYGFGSECPIQFMGLVGTCNGLVCFHVVRYKEMKSFFVWNPATRRIRRIDYPCDEITTWSYACHFGYVSCRDEYRIFGVFSSNVDYFAHCYVFSWRTGEWRRLDEVSKFFPVVEIKDAVLIDDNVYLFRKSNRIVGFDLVNEEMNEYPQLNWVDKYKKASMLQFRGCLSLLCLDFDEVHYDVWMLKEPSEWDSWEKLFSINFTCVVDYGVSETLKCLVRHKGQLKVVDLCRGSDALQLSQTGVDFDSESNFVLKSLGYVESLVSPF